MSCFAVPMSTGNINDATQKLLSRPSDLIQITATDNRHATRSPINF